MNTYICPFQNRSRVEKGSLILCSTYASASCWFLMMHCGSVNREGLDWSCPSTNIWCSKGTVRLWAGSGQAFEGGRSFVEVVVATFGMRPQAALQAYHSLKRPSPPISLVYARQADIGANTIHTFAYMRPPFGKLVFRVAILD
jgi:hypothetical protein